MTMTSIPDKKNPFKSFMTGIIVSTCLAFFFYFGILIVYNYLHESILFLSGFAVFCFLIFWINVKCDQMTDLIDVISKTVAFDFKTAHPKIINSFSRFLRPLNPYVGVSGTISGLLFVLWAPPALIIYWAVHPEPPEMSLKIAVFSMSAATGILYFIVCKDRFPSAIHKITFFTGMSLGLLGVFGLINSA